MWMSERQIEGPILMDEKSLDYKNFLMRMAQIFLKTVHKDRKKLTFGTYYWGETSHENLRYPLDTPV